MKPHTDRDFESSALPAVPRRTVLKAGAATCGALALSRFGVSPVAAKAAGGSGLMRAEDYGVGAFFDDGIEFRFVGRLDGLGEDVDLDPTVADYPATIQYWHGCSAAGDDKVPTSTFVGYLIEDNKAEVSGGTPNQSVMYVYEPRPVSIGDWHVFVEDESCGEEYLKVGYEPGADGAAPEDPGSGNGNGSGNGGGDGDGDDGDHEESAEADDGGDSTDASDGGAGGAATGQRGGADGGGAGGAESGKRGSDAASADASWPFGWLARVFGF